jgi:hypothetical protein
MAKKLTMVMIMTSLMSMNYLRTADNNGIMANRWVNLKQWSPPCKNVPWSSDIATRIFFKPSKNFDDSFNDYKNNHQSHLSFDDFDEHSLSEPESNQNFLKNTDLRGKYAEFDRIMADPILGVLAQTRIKTDTGYANFLSRLVDTDPGRRAKLQEMYEDAGLWGAWMNVTKEQAEEFKSFKYDPFGEQSLMFHKAVIMRRLRKDTDWRKSPMAQAFIKLCGDRALERQKNKSPQEDVTAGR